MAMSWKASVRPSWSMWSTTWPCPRRSPHRAPGSRNGAPLMLSVPPATITSASPHLIAWAASMTAFSPEPQTLFTVCAGTDSGRPALTAACRAGFMPSPACRMQPRITSSTWSGRTPARRTASRTATVPSSTADTSLNAPPKLPMGVRQPERMTTSPVLISELHLLHARLRKGQLRPRGLAHRFHRGVGRDLPQHEAVLRHLHDRQVGHDEVHAPLAGEGQRAALD